MHAAWEQVVRNSIRKHPQIKYGVCIHPFSVAIQRKKIPFLWRQMKHLFVGNKKKPGCQQQFYHKPFLMKWFSLPSSHREAESSWGCSIHSVKTGGGSLSVYLPRISSNMRPSIFMEENNSAEPGYIHIVWGSKTIHVQSKLYILSTKSTMSLEM